MAIGAEDGKGQSQQGGWMPARAASLRSGRPHYAAWSSMPSPHLVEAIAQQDFDLIVLDGQHGQHDKASMMAGIAAAGLYRVPCFARIPIGEFSTASQLADAGALGIIAPMINTIADAKAFAAALKFPPVGGRSWGPNRATAFAGTSRGPDYFELANSITLSIAMIETSEALAIADDILSLPGIDGFLIGPSDLSISLLGRIDAMHAEVDAALTQCLAFAKKHGKIACTFSPTPARAAELAGRGYTVVTVGTDFGQFSLGAKTELAVAKGAASAHSGPLGY